MTSEAAFTGKNIEKAILKACQQLDIKEENLNYEVVSRGSTGIFGLVGVKKAQIKVKIQEKQDDSHVDPSSAEQAGGQPTSISATDPEMSPAALAGLKALEKITAAITAGTSIKTSNDGKKIAYNIEGGKTGVLIGKRGQTLEAMQYLVEKVVNRNSRKRVRVSIDAGGYLAKKRKNLENLAERTAQKAKKNGKPATIGQLNAHDRRIIHLALKRDDEVVTKSVGNGFLRKLVVMPKNRSRSQRRP
jgi:spoIIIJ-associated protein